MKTIIAGSYKKLALGIMLACGANSAQATLMPINDVFLNVWDSTTLTSYVADLGVDVNTFAANQATSQAFTLSSVFYNWASAAQAAGQTLTYNIAGYNYAKPQGSTADSAMLSYQIGSIPKVDNETSQLYAKLASLQGNVKSRVTDINTLTGLADLVISDTAQGGFNTYIPAWGTTEGNGTTLRSTTVGNGGLNQLGVTYWNTTGVSTIKSNTAVNNQQLAGVFSLDIANSTLNWTANSAPVSAVPVPAAVWLFMGGLMMLRGFQKPRSELSA